jgi:hypothetical protein
MFLFCRGEMPSSSSPPPGEPTTVVVVVLRGEEYHVVAAVAGHELETPEAKHRPGLKSLPKIVHLELNGKVFVNTQQTPTWRANYRRFGPARTLDQPVNLTMCVPAQMGWCKMKHKREDEAYIILHRGARSGGYKRCEREREGAPLRWAVWVSLLCVFLSFSASAPFEKALDIPFYRYKEMVQLYMGV